MDEVIGHMREKVEMPNADEIEIYNRKKPSVGADEYLPYKINDGDIVPEMASFGEGYRFHVTGLVHNETGFPTTNSNIAENLTNHLVNKIENNMDDIVEYEEYHLEDAEEIIVAYGSTARSAKSAVDALREEGMKVGMFRPITIWPIAQKQIEKIGKMAKRISVIEMNMGQYYLEVDRIAGKFTKVDKYNRVHGELITPEEIISFIKED
jgi:2-oxoglutarate ferredoxin oxidoreductase subunit alpha